MGFNDIEWAFNVESIGSSWGVNGDLRRIYPGLRWFFLILPDNHWASSGTPGKCWWKFDDGNIMGLWWEIRWTMMKHCQKEHERCDEVRFPEVFFSIFLWGEWSVFSSGAGNQAAKSPNKHNLLANSMNLHRFSWSSEFVCRKCTPPKKMQPLVESNHPKWFWHSPNISISEKKKLLGKV
jgi:hypothetical protein